MTSWDRVFHLMSAGLPQPRYHRGMALRRIAQDAARRRAFRRRPVAEGDLLVGADGLARPCASSICPPGTALCRLRGMARAGGGSRVPAATRDCSTTSLLPAAGEHLLGYPVTGPDNDLRAGHRRYNFVCIGRRARSASCRGS